MKQVIIALTVLVAIMLTAGCGSKTNNSTQSGQGTEKLICNMSLRPAIDSGYTVTRVGVWIIKGAFEDSMNLTISGDTAYGTFNSLSVGTYSISVKAYDNQTLIAEGSGTGEVIAGQTSVARIRLYFVTGGITIIVGWGSEDVWTAKTAMPRAVWALSGIALNGKVYAISGHLEDSTVFWEFNPALNTWSSKTPMPEAHGTSPAVAAVGGKIYVIGGMNTNATHVYDPTLNSWETKTSMPTFRYYAGAAVVDGKIYVIGGLTESGSTSKVEMYDPAMDTWTTKAPMSVARHGLAVVEAGGSIFAIGGDDYNSGTHYALVEEYLPASDTWITKASMPTARRSMGWGVVNGKIYIIGGENSSGHLSVVQEYTPASNTWATKTPMPAPRSHFGCGTDAGKIYCFGGLCSTGYQVTTHECYDPGAE